MQAVGGVNGRLAAPEWFRLMDFDLVLAFAFVVLLFVVDNA